MNRKGLQRNERRGSPTGCAAICSACPPPIAGGGAVSPPPRAWYPLSGSAFTPCPHSGICAFSDFPPLSWTKSVTRGPGDLGCAGPEATVLFLSHRREVQLGAAASVGEQSRQRCFPGQCLLHERAFSVC